MQQLCKVRSGLVTSGVASRYRSAQQDRLQGRRDHSVTHLVSVLVDFFQQQFSVFDAQIQPGMWWHVRLIHLAHIIPNHHMVYAEGQEA